MKQLPAPFLAPSLGISGRLCFCLYIGKKSAVTAFPIIERSGCICEKDLNQIADLYCDLLFDEHADDFYAIGRFISAV